MTKSPAKFQALSLPERPASLRFEVPRVVDRRLEVVALAGATYLDLFDGIGEGAATTAAVAKAISGIEGDFTIRLNSTGGDYFEGLGIFNLLRSHPGRITVQVMGIAASAASVITMAGDRIEIAKTAEIMIHQAWAMAIGNADVMDEVSAVLRRIDDTLAEIYADRTGRDLEEVKAMLRAETFLKGEEAVAAGFADALLDQDAIPKPKTRKVSPSNRIELEDELRNAGFSRAAAKAIAAGGWDGLAKPAPVTVDPAAATSLLHEIQHVTNDLKTRHRPRIDSPSETRSRVVDMRHIITEHELRR